MRRRWRKNICWAIAQVAGRSCCGRYGFTFLCVGVWTFVVLLRTCTLEPRVYSIATCAKFNPHTCTACPSPQIYCTNCTACPSPQIYCTKSQNSDPYNSSCKWWIFLTLVLKKTFHIAIAQFLSSALCACLRLHHERNKKCIQSFCEMICK